MQKLRVTSENFQQIGLHAVCNATCLISILSRRFFRTQSVYVPYFTILPSLGKLLITWLGQEIPEPTRPCLVSKKQHFQDVLEVNGHARCHYHPTGLFSSLITIRLLTLQALILLPLKHPTIDRYSRLRIAHHGIVCHTPTMLAPVETESSPAPDIPFYCLLAFNVHFFRCVVRP